MEKSKKNHWKYYKVGDIIICQSIWGNKRFIVDKMYGNAWCPILDVHDFGKEKRTSTTCLLNPNDCKLVNSLKRPLTRLSREKVLTMMKKGNTEAKREFLIRVFNKNL